MLRSESFENRIEATRMNPRASRLLFVSHPDDETLFFSSILFRYGSSLHVICVTDGNGDGQKTKRQKQFANVMARFGVKSFEFWDEPDRYESRLPTDRIQKRIENMRPDQWKGSPHLKAVFTHGPLGEYGHPHHQDIALAVHRVFFGKCAVYSPAYNLAPDRVYRLSKKEFTLKQEVLSKIYSSETQRFLNLIPATSWEGFVRIHLKEVEALYGFWVGGNLQTSALRKSKWLAPVLPELRERMKQRIF